MANFQFEGELNGLSVRQLEYVSSVLEDLGFNNEKVNFSVVGKAGDNFVTNVKRITVEKNGETFKMIAKIAPTTEELRMTLPTKEFFRNEHNMYTRVLPKFTELEKRAKIPQVERFRYAACYGSLSEEPNEIILLEDLQPSNFVMLDKLKSLTDETVKLLLRNFAKFHSLSYVFKNQEPETYEAIKNELINTWTLLANDSDFDVILTSLEADAIDLLNNEKHKNAIDGLVTKLKCNAIKSYEIDKDSKFGVFQQGDAWTNNFMFTLEGDEAVNCCMIDYQGSCQISPASDILFMIFMCTDYETRSKHYQEWIDYYHVQLGKCLVNFGLEINVVYPREQLDVDLKRLGKLNLGISILILSFVIRDTDEAAKYKEAIANTDKVEDNFDAIKMTNMAPASRTRYKTKLNEIFDSFFELGYFN